MREHAQAERTMPKIRHMKEDGEPFKIGGSRGERVNDTAGRTRGETPAPRSSPRPLWGDPPDFGRGMSVEINVHHHEAAGRLAGARMSRAAKKRGRRYSGQNDLGNAEYPGGDPAQVEEE